MGNANVRFEDLSKISAIPMQKFPNLVPIPDVAPIGLARYRPDNGYCCGSDRGYIGPLLCKSELIEKLN